MSIKVVGGTKRERMRSPPSQGRGGKQGIAPPADTALERRRALKPRRFLGR